MCCELKVVCMMQRIAKHLRTSGVESQKGFLAAPLLFGIIASIASLTLAGSYLNIFDRLISQQQTIQAKNKLEQLATILSESSTNQIRTENGTYTTTVYTAPPMAEASGAGALTGTPPAFPDGGRLPAGFAGLSKFGDIRYFSYVHTRNAADPVPDGYFATGQGGIPGPDELSFALILPGKDGVITTTEEQMKQKVFSGDDIGVVKTVKDVNGNDYKDLIERAGDIPPCGLTGSGEDAVHKKLSWNRDELKWECVDGVKKFAINDPINTIGQCPSGQALTSHTVEINGSTKTVLECINTVIPKARSATGQMYDESGQVHNLIHHLKAVGNPCQGLASSLIKWTDTSLHCDQIVYASASENCAPGHYLARSFSNYTTCFAFNTENLNRNGGVGWRQTCSSGRTPYFADGKTFCEEDGFGGKPLCAPGFEAAMAQTMGGLGCYILADPLVPGGKGLSTAAHYENVPNVDDCPAGSVMQLISTERALVKCVNIFEVIGFAMPAATCPNGMLAKKGALKWNANTNRFTCGLL